MSNANKLARISLKTNVHTEYSSIALKKMAEGEQKETPSVTTKPTRRTRGKKKEDGIHSDPTSITGSSE